MKYIIENLEPILLGACIALIGVFIFNGIMDLLAKIAILKYK